MRRLLLRSLPGLLVVGGVLALFPSWLPAGLGGDAHYTYILSGSMRPTFDRGAFVVLLPAQDYRLGDVAGYWLDVGQGRRVIIVHRIVGRLSNGDFLFKGDANPSSERVEAERVVGRAVLVVPYLGWALMVFQTAPHLLGFLLLLLAFLPGTFGQPSRERSEEGGFPWFFLALGVMALGAPLMEVGLVRRWGLGFALGLFLTLLMGTRALERLAPLDRLGRALVELNYVLVIALVLASIPFPRVVGQIRGFFS